MAERALTAGAIAVLVVNNVAGDPTAMASDGTPNQPTVPAYMVSQADLGDLVAADGLSTTIGAALSYVNSDNDNIMAGFSSQGPVDVSLRVKPDVVAPGVNVLSSIPMAACDAPPCFAFFSGTSMASPHLAGSAAIVRQQHPTWTAAQVRSAIVNTADQGVLTRYQDATPINDVLIVGAGLENLDDAVQAQVGLDPVSVAFGGVPSGSGQTRTQTVTVTNLSGSAASYSFAVSNQPSGVTYSVTPGALDLAAGESATVTVTAKVTAGAGTGPKQAFLRVSSGGSEIAHAVLFTWVK
jgi:subtilisin family serine protease